MNAEALSIENILHAVSKVGSCIQIFGGFFTVARSHGPKFRDYVIYRNPNNSV